MWNRAAALLLVVLLTTWVVPVDAADGMAGVEPGPGAGPAEGAPPSPDPQPTPDPSPLPESSPSLDASSDPGPGAGPDPSLSPSGEPVLLPDTADPPSPGPSIAPADPSAAPQGAPDAAAAAEADAATLDVTGRFIVMLRPGADARKARDRHAAREGLKADRLFEKALRGFSAKLTSAQRGALTRDPDVLAIVPDEIVSIAGQIIPTGVSRVGATQSVFARIDGVDGPGSTTERVDADVAIVDTGVDPNHPDLNVVGGHNCSTSSPTGWYDSEGHGTHVAGTVAALDNGIGVVGVAPGARIWSVRILNNQGNGYLSWYVCGLDWIAAQRDPTDPSRPLFEAVNMSVAKWGSDDHACGAANNDILHQAICRLVASGVTVVAAAANNSGPAAKRVPAAYDEVITVSALADTDGKPGGQGGNRCWSWGSYDRDDTYADFSNYGPDVDIIAPGKCIWSTRPGNRYAYLSGTSMAAPHVTGAAALYKSARPWASPADVKDALVALGTYGWTTRTDPDGHPDRLLDVSKIGPYGDFTMGVGSSATFAAPAGGSVSVPINVNRSSTFVERVSLGATSSSGLGLSFSPWSLVGLSATRSTLNVTVPVTASPGRYEITVTGTEHGRTRQTTVAIQVLHLTRLAGADRFGTAAAVSAATFSPGVPVVYIASAYAFPDALSGAAAAGTIKGPVLLAAPTGPLHGATIAELRRLAPARIVILGGSGAISNAVAALLAGYTSGPVTRLAGADRFGTAAAVSAATFSPGVPVVYIASAYAFPDALSGAAAAGTIKGPVLLAAPTGPLHGATIAELRRLAPARIVILGGSGAISNAVAALLAGYTSGPVTRLAGADRFGTAAAVSAATFSPGVPVVYIASAYAFPDALSGAAAAGTIKGPVLLAAPTGPLHGATIAELRRLAPARIVILGGSGAISNAVAALFESYTSS